MKISFDRKYLPLVNSIDGVKYTLSTKWERVNAQRRVLTSSKSIALCGIRGRYCHSPRCGHCSKRLYGQTIAGVRDASAIHAHGSAELLTLTFANLPEGKLAEGYAQLDTLYRQAFTKSSWLKKYSDGYVKATEVTTTLDAFSTWNLHIHLLVVHDEENKYEGQRLIDRWNLKAMEHGISVSPSAQQTKPVNVNDVPKTAAYVLKQNLLYTNSNSSSYTPGDLLNAATRGDARAAELLSEFELASKGHHARRSGGTLKAPKKSRKDAKAHTEH